jgi:hypothetical protein
MAVWLQLIVISLLYAQAPANDTQTALETLRRMVTDQNYAQLGFAAPKDVAGATVDIPLRRYFVTDGLRDFKEGNDPTALLHAGGEFLYPVRAAGKVRCFITMANRGSGWRGVSFGQAEIAQMLTGARDQHPGGPNIPVESYFAVDILPLSIFLLGWQADGKFPEDATGATLFLFSAATQTKKPPEPLGAQSAGTLFKIFRDQVRRKQRGAPGAGRRPN